MRPAFRGRGIGKALMVHLARRCVAEGWTRFEWSVLDWNTPSIAFYKSIGAQLKDEWVICRVSGDALRRLGGAGMMQIVLVAAVAENGVIGRGGTMPWRLKSDMAHFRALTLGKPVLMGRKTYLSLHVRPLPRRTNIVVSRDPAFTADGALVARSFETALEAARGDAARRGAT